MILGQSPPRKFPPNPKTNPNPTSNPNRGSMFLQGNCLVAPNPKTNPNRDPNPNPNREAIFLGGNFPDTVRHKTDALENFKKMNKKTSATASTLF